MLRLARRSAVVIRGYPKFVRNFSLRDSTLDDTPKSFEHPPHLADSPHPSSPHPPNAKEVTTQWLPHGFDTRSDRSRFEKFDSAPLRHGEALQKFESRFNKVDSALYHGEKFEKFESRFDKVESALQRLGDRFESRFDKLEWKIIGAIMLNSGLVYWMFYNTSQSPEPFSYDQDRAPSPELPRRPTQATTPGSESRSPPQVQAATTSPVHSQK